MKKTIRCCISCILPCGALDVIRIVHSNGRVEEISGSVRAGDVMRAHPKHVLKKPSSSSDPNIVVVPPDALLQRGKIYFLMPPPSSTATRSNRRSTTSHHPPRVSNNNNNVSDRYLTEILSEKLSATQRDRRRGRAAVWRPHLQSISESPNHHA